MRDLLIRFLSKAWHAARQGPIAFTSRNLWLVLIAVTLLCTFMEPFGSSVIPMGLSLIYWALICFGTGLLSVLFFNVAAIQAYAFKQLVVLSLIFAASAMAMVSLISLLLLRPVGLYPGFWLLAQYSFFSALLIFTTGLLVWRCSLPLPSQIRAAPQGRPMLLSKVPELAEASTIWALSAEDHYVRVMSDQGSALLLMRLSDAMEACAETGGLQIHRSHWVALSAITNTLGKGVPRSVRLPNGAELPVSRPYQPVLAAALEKENKG